MLANVKFALHIFTQLKCLTQTLPLGVYTTGPKLAKHSATAYVNNDQVSPEKQKCI